MITPRQLWCLIFLAAVLWAGALRLQGVSLTWQAYQPFSTVVGILAGAIWCFDKYLWRWWPFSPVLSNRPNISGTWKVLLVSDYKNPDTLKVVDPKICYMRIYQTYSKLSMRLMTDESSSEILAASVQQTTADGFRVIGVYMNEPKVLIHGKSPIHYGGISLSIQGSPPNSLEGSYWTTRKTCGEMTLSNRSPELFDDYKSANEAFA